VGEEEARRAIALRLIRMENAPAPVVREQRLGLKLE